ALGHALAGLAPEPLSAIALDRARLPAMPVRSAREPTRAGGRLPGDAAAVAVADADRLLLAVARRTALGGRSGVGAADIRAVAGPGASPGSRAGRVAGVRGARHLRAGAHVGRHVARLARATAIGVAADAVCAIAARALVAGGAGGPVRVLCLAGAAVVAIA